MIGPEMYTEPLCGWCSTVPCNCTFRSEPAYGLAMRSYCDARENTPEKIAERLAEREAERQRHIAHCQRVAADPRWELSCDICGEVMGRSDSDCEGGVMVCVNCFQKGSE